MISSDRKGEREPLADVQPLQAIQYAPDIDLSRVICPPFDTISPQEQSRLYRLGPHNAVRLELPKGNGDQYQKAAKTLRQWLDKGTLVRQQAPSLYVYQQEFSHGGETYQRRILFGRLRLEPWEAGSILPHERTFRAPKEDRLKLLHALRLNTSAIFLIYPDSRQQVAPLVARSIGGRPNVEFTDENGLAQGLWRIDDPHETAAISRALEKERLYVADGHHRYETALAYGDEPMAVSVASRSAAAAADFTLVALAAVDDPGLLVLPIHRLVNAGPPLEKALNSLTSPFQVETRPSLADLTRDMADRGRTLNSFGLVAAGSPDFYLLTLLNPEAASPYLPSQCSVAWRRLDAAVATHVILRHSLGLNDEQMEDIGTVWFGENAEAAVTEVRKGRAKYAVLLNAISPRQVLAVADAGERMPQKSTFFYPKIPTGLLFNPLFDI
jgi:uncharacterized protein (DUF1015 family)